MVLPFVGRQSAPGYVLSLHSSKALIVEPVKGPSYMLADSVIQLAVAKGDRHEVSHAAMVFDRFRCKLRERQRFSRTGSEKIIPFVST